jgi:multidrug efflux pump subunit AcrA (membrane-fusion protein)
LHGQYAAKGRIEWNEIASSILKPFRSQKSTIDSHQDAHDHGHDHPHDEAGHSVSAATKEDSHDEHDHDAHSDSKSIELTPSAMKNIGLTEEFLKPIELTTFQKSITVPAIVVDRPGRTRLPVSAPMTGIVTHVHAVAGEAIEPGELILEMRLTHEDLVTAQREYLQALGDLAIENKEIDRLEQLSDTGALSNKSLLERQYSRDKIQALLRSHREALRLHGLSESQINTIESTKRLLTEMRIVAPSPDDHEHEDEIQLCGGRRQTYLVSMRAGVPAASDEETPSSTVTPVLVLQELLVQKGQVVNAGQLLCTLADYDHLLLEGQAFESESHLVAKAKQSDSKVAAVLEEGGIPTKLQNLNFGWVDNEIDPQRRTLKFFIELPNELLQDSRKASGQRFATWRYRTGQRMQLLIPVETWADQIVLPVDAVTKEGLDCFVFQQNGDHFEQVAVHEMYRDQTSVVIENDGSIYPGDVVALRGAHQMQMALKNKSGGAVDPHAGHSH